MIFPRLLNAYLGKWLGRRKSLLVWGPRQTGKTTIIERWLGSVPRTWEQHHYLFQDPSVRRRVERNPSVIAEELEAGPRSRKLVFIDEVQKVPAIMDSLQLLMDTHGAQWCPARSIVRP